MTKEIAMQVEKVLMSKHLWVGGFENEKRA